MKMKKLVSCILALAVVVAVSGACFAGTAILDDQAVRYIRLTGDGASFECGGVTASGSVVAISAPGIYSVSGTLNDGQIVISVNKDEKVHLELAGVDITSLTGAAVYVSSADKVTVSVAEGTENFITSGTADDAATFDPSRTGAAVYADADLKINGHGSLFVTGNINNGVATKKDLDIKNCQLTVHAVNNGIKGKNSVEISDASVVITAGNDGIKTESEKEGKGYVTITGSALDIIAPTGIKASGQILIVQE